jgi:hypothetical protein
MDQSTNGGRMFKVIMALSLMLGLQAFAEEGSWTDKIKMSGDLRIRHDYLKMDDSADRHRERYRLRLATTAKVNDKMTAKVRLASADGGGDPLSANSTFTDNASKKAIYVDLASIDWRFSDNCGAVVGKQENPLRILPGSQLVFDADYTPEGLAIDGKMDSIFAKLAGFSLAERKPTATGESEPDSYLLSAMLGFKNGDDAGSGFLFAAAYHQFTALKDNAALASALTPPADTFAGNTSYGAGRYKNDYKVLEGMAEFHSRLSTQKISLFLDGVSNSVPDNENKGILGGITLSGLNDQDKVEWTLGFNYRDVDHDATVSVINDSDFANGVDGSHGPTFIAGYAVMENAMVTLSYYMATVDNTAGLASYKTERGFLDFQVNF